MVSNTRSVFFGLMLSAAQLSSASPAASADTAFIAPIYPTATVSIPALPSSTDACLAKCNAAHDKCNTAPNANHATCAAEYAECIGYNPYGGASYVAPTACSHSSKPTAIETAKADKCVMKCDKAHDACNTAPNANHAQCSAEYAECLGYNPYGSGSLVAPTACSHSAKPTATETAKAGDCLKKCNKAHDACNVAPNANHATCAAEWAECLGYNPYNGPGGSLVEPTACAAHTTMASATGKHTSMETSKPASTEASKPAKSSEPAVVVNGAGSLSGKVAGLAGAIGAAAVALL
ncbi:surface protein SP1 [Fusarium subglutinans]|uniref:Surface protein SP1 n=1 Tax=Gibberella subglutinans TaxID=42677 RepID=A0A8H5QB60_GIBSU|nr:surface protein SP1 [Fusarium subglutinans]KAF5610763.1 surface protein SP1 [Fusarium subglutinans]